MLEDLAAFVGCTFSISIDMHDMIQVTEVGALKQEQDVIDLKQNNARGDYIPRRLLGRPKMGEFSVTRPLTSNPAWDDWVKAGMEGKMSKARRTLTVMVHSLAGIPIREFVITGAVVKAQETSAFKAGDSSAMTEKISIAFEKVEFKTKGK